MIPGAKLDRKRSEVLGESLKLEPGSRTQLTLEQCSTVPAGARLNSA